MLLTPRIELRGFASLVELAAIPNPVRATQDDHGAFIDVLVGLRQIEVSASPPLTGWRQLIEEDTRFEIAQGTTGLQLAAAFSDEAVIHAIEQVISPPPMNLRKMSRQEIAQLTGTENMDECVANLIDALGKHMKVLRKKPARRGTPIQASLL